MRSISGTSARNRLDRKGLPAITGDSASLSGGAGASVAERHK
jgi:hypothetical protein